jgi:SAM-dependent methyltransferase
MNKDLKSFYDHGYHNKIHKAMIASDEYYLARSLAFRDLYFSSFEENLKVLDYGCGLGQAVASLPNPFGYDASEEARSIARSKGLTVFDLVDDIPINNFDIVLCRHALEHFPNPTEVLTRLRSFLNPDGILIIIVPKEGHYKCDYIPDLNMHLFSWNFRCINNLLSISGYRVESNFELYNLGFRQLLWFRRLFGDKLYLLATKLVGRIYNNGELIIHAKARDDS